MENQSVSYDPKLFIFLFFSLFVLPLLFKFCESGRHAMDWDIVVAPHFLPFLELIWLVLWILTRWLLEGECISSLFKCMKWRWIKRWGEKSRVESSIFTNGKRFKFTRDVWTNFHFKEEHQAKKRLWYLVLIHWVE